MIMLMPRRVGDESESGSFINDCEEAIAGTHHLFDRSGRETFVGFEHDLRSIGYLFIDWHQLANAPKNPSSGSSIFSGPVSSIVLLSLLEGFRIRLIGGACFDEMDVHPHHASLDAANPALLNELRDVETGSGPAATAKAWRRSADLRLHYANQKT